MSLFNEWTNSTPASTSKKNLTSVISGTGAYLAGLTKPNFKILVCTSTGSGFTLDHVYLINAAGDTAIDLSVTQDHNHAGSSTGGSLLNIIKANPIFMDLALTRTNDLKKAQWIETVTDTGTIADDTDGSGERSIKLLTGTTSGSGSTISYPHLQLDFSKRSVFQFKARLSSTTSVALHSGIGADNVTAADSNTVKYNAEVCTVTNSNWHLRSATGSSNSSSDTGTAMSTSRLGVKIEHYPTDGTPRLDMYINAGSAFQKTTNIPTTGATADNNLIKHSVKNSSTSDKNYFVYGSRLAYTVNDDWV